jgi:hypothetical protein
MKQKGIYSVKIFRGYYFARVTVKCVICRPTYKRLSEKRPVFGINNRFLK